MKRREFLAASAGLVLAPALPTIIVKPDMRLRCETFTTSDDFCPHKYRVWKGPYESVGHAGVGQDIIDSHGICATEEWAWLVREELEYGPNYREMFYRMSELPFHEFYDEERKRIQDSMRVVQVTKPEFWRMVRFFAGIRGPHDCILQHYRSQVPWRMA